MLLHFATLNVAHRALQGEENPPLDPTLQRLFCTLDHRSGMADRAVCLRFRFMVGVVKIAELFGEKEGEDFAHLVMGDFDEGVGQCTALVELFIEVGIEVIEQIHGMVSGSG